MRWNFLKMGLGLGVLAAAAWALPACSGSTTNGGGGSGGTTGSAGTAGSTGTAGSGGTDAGAAGSGGTDAGAAGSGGAAGSDAGGSVTCGSSSCASFSYQGLITLAGCCTGPNNDKCGSDLSQVHQFVPQIPSGCEEHNQPGIPDNNCPTVSLGGQFSAPGCCRANGVCGVMIDLSQAGGPNFGCVDASSAMDGGTPQSCSPDGGGAGGSGAGGADGGAG